MPAKAINTYNILELHRNIVQSQGHMTHGKLFLQGKLF